VAIRAKGDALMMATMHFTEEVAPAKRSTATEVSPKDWARRR